MVGDEEGSVEAVAVSPEAGAAMVQEVDIVVATAAGVEDLRRTRQAVLRIKSARPTSLGEWRMNLKSMAIVC